LYRLDIADDVYKRLSKLNAKDPELLRKIYKKVGQIRRYPYHFKPLRSPFQNKRRVHVGGSFVIIYEIEETEKLIKLIAFDHHDKAYRSD